MGIAVPVKPYEVPRVSDHSDSEEPPDPTQRPQSIPDADKGVVAYHLSRKLSARVARLEGDVGRAPDPSASPPDLGIGMRRALAEIKVELGEIKAIVTRGEAARAAQSARAWWAVWVFVGALLCLLAGAIWRLGDHVRLVQGEPTHEPLSQR